MNGARPLAWVGLVLLGAVLGTVLLTGGPAYGHNGLAGSDPADGATLDSAPAAITLTWRQQPARGSVAISVTDPTGAQVAAAPVEHDGRAVSVPFAPTVPGQYSVRYSITAGDGHTSTGTLRFTLMEAAVPAPVTAGPSPTATSAPSPSAAAQVDAHSDGGRWWPWLLGAAVVVGAAGGGFALARRRAGRTGG